MRFMVGLELPPRMALVHKGASADPEIVVWNARGDRATIKGARSMRQDVHAAGLQSPDAAGDRGWASVAVDRRGTAHAIWLDHRDLAAAGFGEENHARHRRADAHDGVAMAQKSGLYYAALQRRRTRGRDRRRPRPALTASKAKNR